EADDIIGTLSHEANQEEYQVKVITGDQDLLQLVAENVTVDLTKKGISEVISYNPDALMENMMLKPEQIIELKAIMGATSDNIPSVPGVGIKTATKLLQQYHTLENLYEHIDEITAKKLNENLTKYKDDAFMSKDLATIDTNSPLEIDLEDITYKGYE